MYIPSTLNTDNILWHIQFYLKNYTLQSKLAIFSLLSQVINFLVQCIETSNSIFILPMKKTLKSKIIQQNCRNSQYCLDGPIYLTTVKVKYSFEFLQYLEYITLARVKKTFSPPTFPCGEKSVHRIFGTGAQNHRFCSKA